MSYMKARWFHENPDYPTLLYAELDENRNELRKVDVFTDGHLQAASADFTTDMTMLGLEPTPPLEEINRDAEFDAAEIDAEAFEVVWQQATAHRQARR